MNVSTECQKMTKKSLFIPSLIPHIHSFDYWLFAKSYSNQTLSFFDILKKLCLTSHGKRCFFLITIVLEVEKKHDRSGSLRHRAPHCPQQPCVVSIPLDVSLCSRTALLFCSEERSTGVCRAPWGQGHREADSSQSWGSEIAMPVSSSIILKCVILVVLYSSLIL